MRYAATLALFVVASAAGCRGNSTPLTNPFLTPDRVPPPTTQTLAPGMAAPYYQGEPMPTAAPLAAPAGAVPGMPAIPAVPAGAAPAGTFAPGAVPPATAYPGAAYPASQPSTAYPVTPTPTTQPLNYGAQATPSPGDSVGVPKDDQSLRFASASLTPTSTPSPAAAAATAPASNAQFRTPIQSMLPLAGSADPNAQRPFAPNAGAPGPVAGASTGGVVPAGYEAPIGSAAVAGASSADGFRPQGSQPAAASSDAGSAKGFRPPSIGSQTAGGDSPTGRFGVGPQQEWLRGQLEYWPETGEWSINYMDEGPKDQIGGRVLIDNPQLLANLSPGEFVMVEGQLHGRQIDEAYYRPAYRISAVQRQRQ